MKSARRKQPLRHFRLVRSPALTGLTSSRVSRCLSMRYPGGKGRCYQHLISLMPPHRTYIETHLGGGAVLRHKRPAERSYGIDKDVRVIEKWRSITLPGTTVLQGDAIELLAALQPGSDDLVYCDPPYPKETRRRAKLYRHDYDVEEHGRLLDTLRRLPCKVMVSSYDNDLYVRLLSDWRLVRFPGDSHVGPRVESVWLNFPEPRTLHDYTYCGGDFRGRERQRRRKNGLMRRIEALTELERGALFRDLAARFGSEIRDAIGPSA